MGDGAGIPPQGRGEEQPNPWAPPSGPAAGASGKQGDVPPPPIPTAPDGPGRGPAYGHGAQAGSYGYGQGGGQAYGPGGYAAPGAPGGGHPGAGAYGGHPGGPAAYGYGWQPPLPAGASNAAMVLGIVSLVLVTTCWGSFLSLITSTIALCLGVSARRRVAAGELGGQPQATSGFVMGIVGLSLSVIISTVLVLMLTVWTDDLDGNSDPDGSSDSYDARGTVPTLLVHR